MPKPTALPPSPHLNTQMPLSMANVICRRSLSTLCRGQVYFLFQRRFGHFGVPLFALKGLQTYLHVTVKKYIWKCHSVTEWCRCGKWGVVHTNVEYLSYGKVEAFEYFQLSDMRYNDRNVVTERVSTPVLLYLIWTPAQILQQVIEFQKQI